MFARSFCNFPILCLFATLSGIAFADDAESPFVSPEGVDYRTVDIVSEGTRIHAELFQPEGNSSKLPTIIMSHGWGGVAEHLRPDAITFARAGYLVVVFDYRGWGLSDGRLVPKAPLNLDAKDASPKLTEVRGVVDPIDQTTDIMNVVHWVQGESDCDAEKIGLWGSSFSGGHVVYVAARDPRIKAFVSQVGAMDGRWAINDSAMRQLTFQQATARAQGKAGYPPEGQKFGSLTGMPILEKVMRYAPIEDIGRCDDVAKLFIVAENEELFDNRDHAILAHKRAGGVKKLVVVEDITHYGIYQEKRKLAQELAIDWFDQHLK